MWDIFISHAWEDKEAVARPLAEGLREVGLAVWYDEFALRLGDSLRRSINRGLNESRYGLVILSPAFFRGEWPQTELDGLAARELQGGKVVLPVWHNVTHDDVLQFSAPLADKLAASTRHGLDFVIQQVLAVAQPHTGAAPPADLAPPQAEDESLAQAVAEYQDILAPFLLLPELSQTQRRLLERTRRRLGLSREHAQQIERSLREAQPPPTPSARPAPQPVRAAAVQLRREPLTVSPENFNEVFGLSENRRPLEYIQNDYEAQGDVVIDHATGLMWQKSGSEKSLTYTEAISYINSLNWQQFAGHTGWRPPTVPELMSLLESEKQSNELYINPIFDHKQSSCWSADSSGENTWVVSSAGAAWLVRFGDGLVRWRTLYSKYYVRGVRS